MGSRMPSTMGLSPSRTLTAMASLASRSAARMSLLPLTRAARFRTQPGKSSWMMGDESQKLQAASLNVPAIKGIPFDDKDATSDFSKQVLKDQITQLGDSFGKREFLYPEIKSALGDALQYVATGDQTPADALSAVQKASEKIKR